METHCQRINETAGGNMRQKRICEYLGLSCKHTKTFLHLPPLVRRRVYEAAGLMIGGDVVLRCGRPSPRYQRVEEDDAYRFIFNVLQTCRAIHDEVLHIIYTGNRITVHHSSVDYLRQLPSRTCSELRDLYIHLYIGESPDEPASDLTLSAPPRQSWVNAWHAAATHLLAHAKPRTLALHLICDTGDSDKTRAVLRPLLSYPGILADCQIRLHPTREGRISVIAQEAGMRAKGLDPDLRKQPFRFLDLPVELRTKALKYTDLVTPWNEVQWSPETGFHITFGTYCHCMAADEDALEAYYSHPYQFRHCESDHADVTGSFCSARRSSYSPHCQCWTPPQALMLVSRAIYRDAIEVLYSCNRIVVMPVPNTVICNLKDNGLRGRLSASRFLTRHMWPEVLSNLRSLELVLPDLDVHGSCPEPMDSMHADWCFAIDHLRSHSRLSAMTLILHMRLAFRYPGHRVRPAAGRRVFEHYLAACRLQPAVNLALAPYNALLEPLNALREGGLQRLYIFLEWDWHWSPPEGCAPRRCRFYRDELDRSVDQMEIELEKMVMGRDYDSSAVGKKKELPSQWMLAVECRGLGFGG